MSTAPVTMRMAELAKRSGVAVATIKYYLREGLLPAGERTAPNQAMYGEGHVQRLALIRALRELAGLSVERIARICAEIDRPGLRMAEQMGVVADAISGRDERRAESQPLAKARADIVASLEELGWAVRPRAAAVDRLAEALLTLRALYYADLPAQAFEPYARAALEIAGFELGERAARMTRVGEVTLEQVVKGTILWEPVLLGMRRLAHEHVVSTRAVDKD